MSWQETVQTVATAAGALFVAGTLIVLIRQLRSLRTQVALASAESARRLRPWLGLTGVHLVRRGEQTATDGTQMTRPPERELHQLCLKFNNVGALPAENTRLDIEQIRFTMGGKRQELSPADLRDIVVGTVFPGEKSEHFILAAKLTDLDILIGETQIEAEVRSSTATGFIIMGILRYQSGNNKHATSFRASFDAKRDIFSAWRNLDTT